MELVWLPSLRQHPAPASALAFRACVTVTVPTDCGPHRSPDRYCGSMGRGGVAVCRPAVVREVPPAAAAKHALGTLAGPDGSLAAVVSLFARESKRLGTGGFGFASLGMLANLSGPQPTPTSESSRPCQHER